MGCLNNNTRYDSARNLIKTTYPNGTTIDYQYDNASRLKSIIDSKPDGWLNATYNYNLDQLGNRTTISSYQPLNAIPSLPDTSYTHNTDNRLLTAGSTTLDYDNNGNLIIKTLGGNVTNYTWNFNDMLTQLTNGGNTYTYRYDGLGNRVARIENSVEKRYVGGLAETDSSGNITAYYVYGLGLISKITPSNQSYFYYFDGLGSTVAISDSSGGVINKYTYDAFGKVLNQEEVIPNPFKYVGQFGVMDEGNGLFYMRGRYYDPEAGRFINKDPIGFAGGLNLYAYVQNNPMNFVDPLGLTYASNWNFFWDWALGGSNNTRTYGPNDIETKEVQKSIGVQKLRNRFYKGGCKSFTDGSYGTVEAYWETTINPFTADWSSTAAQVGGFAGATVVNNGNGTVTFTIKNIAGMHSFFLHLVPNNVFGSTGPMGNIYQTFQWTE